MSSISLHRHVRFPPIVGIQPKVRFRPIADIRRSSDVTPMLVATKRRRAPVLVATVTLCAACGSGWEQDGVSTSPNGRSRLMVEQSNWGGGAGGINHRVHYRVGDHEVLILSGSRGHPVTAHWFGDAFVVLEYCGGLIDEFRPSARSDPSLDPVEQPRIRFQVIVQPDFSYGGTQFCANDTGPHARP